MSWHKHLESSWFRSDLAAAAKPHDENANVTGDYWLAWAPYVTANAADPAHHDNVLCRRFKTREAAMAYVDKTWPLETQE